MRLFTAEYPQGNKQANKDSALKGKKKNVENLLTIMTTKLIDFSLSMEKVLKLKIEFNCERLFNMH